ncbi:nucleoside triphosphate pyrophosphohydrolase [Labrenzia sp. THAF82]|uniref:NUDIX domain-containing protein n=1 Tax=Labrenzia sp. THAF82 TaxID=2587861 RepID=UPI0012A7AF4F|nr:nucleoside triphosphate pyrophosphohydrolase [Labrenzia sp. THAF82]
MPHIKFPNFWDLPGGGIEACETPFEAVQREVAEELGLAIDSKNIVWAKTYTNTVGLSSYFFAAPVSCRQIDKIEFGEEGQRWDLMPSAQFCTSETVVPHFRARVAEFFAQL